MEPSSLQNCVYLYPEHHLGLVAMVKKLVRSSFLLHGGGDHSSLVNESRMLNVKVLSRDGTIVSNLSGAIA